MLTTSPLRLASPIAPDAIVLPGLGVVETAIPRGCALVGPDLIALAKHYTPPAAAAVSFYGNAISSVKGVVASYGDLLIMRLNDRIGDIVSPAEIATLPEVFKSSAFITVGLKDLRSFVASSVYPRTIYTTGKLAKFPQTYAARLEKRDSGSPSYVNVQGIWKYLGSHYAITPTEYFSNLASLYADQIPKL